MDSNLTREELELYYYFVNDTGSFTNLIIRALLKADSENFSKMRLVFPELCEVIFRYKYDLEYWASIEKRYKSRYES